MRIGLALNGQAGNDTAGVARSGQKRTGTEWPGMATQGRRGLAEIGRDTTGMQ